MIKDSGDRREFNTGAVRDIPEGKGRCDLMPLDVADTILKTREKNDEVLLCIECYKNCKQPTYLEEALENFIKYYYSNPETALLEVSKHFEAGAEKYGEYNWQKGIPVHSYIDSAVRHYLKHRRGDNDEPHDRAFVWNMMCAIWTIDHKPEMIDIPKEERNE